MDPNQPVTPNIPPPFQPQVPVEAPVPPQQPQSEANPPKASSNKLTWIVLATIVILLAAGAYYYFAMVQNSANLTTYPSPTVIPTSTGATETPMPTVTPIQSSSDLDGALNEVDSTLHFFTGIGLDQNIQDSTTFTP